MKTTILVLDTSLEPTGAFRAAFTNILLLRSRYRFIFIITTESKLDAVLDDAGIEWRRIPVRHISRSMGNNLRFPFATIAGTRALLKIMEQERADIVYQNEVFIITGALARMFRKFRLVTHVRVLPRIFPKALYAAWYRLNAGKSDAVAAVSYICKSEVEALAGPQPRMEVLYDFIIPDEVLPPYETHGGDGPLKVLFIGNYTRGKGQDLAIAACGVAAQSGSPRGIELHLWGSDFGHPANVAFRKELEAAAAESPATIVLHDFATGVEALMKGHDILLNLSVAESFSFVVAEGLSYGIPVIATRSGGPVELIEDGVSGLLTDSTPEAVAERLTALAHDAALRDRISRQGPARIRALVTERGGVARFEALLTGIARPPEY